MMSWSIALSRPLQTRELRAFDCVCVRVCAWVCAHVANCDTWLMGETGTKSRTGLNMRNSERSKPTQRSWKSHSEGKIINAGYKLKIHKYHSWAYFRVIYLGDVFKVLLWEVWSVCSETRSVVIKTWQPYLQAEKLGYGPKWKDPSAWNNPL